jgi:hypothetical protein
LRARAAADLGTGELATDGWHPGVSHPLGARMLLHHLQAALPPPLHGLPPSPTQLRIPWMPLLSRLYWSHMIASPGRPHDLQHCIHDSPAASLQGQLGWVPAGGYYCAADFTSFAAFISWSANTLPNLHASPLMQFSITSPCTSSHHLCAVFIRIDADLVPRGPGGATVVRMHQL